MPLAMDMSGDYLLWDFPEAVTLRRNKGNGQYGNLAVGTALRAQPSQKERYPTAGVYTGTDLTWLLPGPLLSGLTPQPSDLVVDGAGAVWTVLSRDYDQLDQVHQLYSVNLALANQLYDTVDVQRAGITYDTAGGPVRAWPDNNAAGVSPGGSTAYAALAARVQKLTDAEAEERGIRGLKGTFTVIVGQQIAVGSEDRLKVNTGAHAGLYLTVRDYHNPERIDELPVLTATLDV